MDLPAIFGLLFVLWFHLLVFHSWYNPLYTVWWHNSNYETLGWCKRIFLLMIKEDCLPTLLSCQQVLLFGHFGVMEATWQALGDYWGMARKYWFFLHRLEICSLFPFMVRIQISPYQTAKLNDIINMFEASSNGSVCWKYILLILNLKCGKVSLPSITLLIRPCYKELVWLNVLFDHELLRVAHTRGNTDSYFSSLSHDLRLIWRQLALLGKQNCSLLLNRGSKTENLNPSIYK